MSSPDQDNTLVQDFLTEASELVEALVDDPGTGIIVAYIEGVADGRALMRAGARAIAAAFRLALHKSAHGFEPVTAPAAPADFDVVLLGKAPSLGLHHCGVYWQGGVLHALETGAVYQDLASLRDTYPLMEFWRKAAVQPVAPAPSAPEVAA